MVKSRDRHGRGLRGRLAWPNPYTATPVPLRGHQTPEQYFATCLGEALRQIEAACPRALAAVDVGMEDVPTVDIGAFPGRVPLATALSPTLARNGQVVLYRRPLERRAATRKGLKILVYRTIVEQLTSITGIPADEIDPSRLRDDDDPGGWDD